MSYKASGSHPDSFPSADQSYIATQCTQGLQNNILMATNDSQQQQQFQQQQQQQQQQPPQQQQPQPQQQQPQQQWTKQPTVENSDLKEKLNCKKTLNEYILDFLTKSSLKNTAAAFAQDAQLSRDIDHEEVDGPNFNESIGNRSSLSKVVETPQGFLYEWWQIFWDVFNTSSSRGGSEFAQQYYQLVLQEQRQEQIYRSLAVHAARLQHDAERRGEYISEDVDPMHLAAMMLGNSMSPAAPVQNVNVNPMPIAMVGNPIVNNFPIPPYNNTNLSIGAAAMAAAASPSGDFANMAPTQNRNQNFTGWPVYSYPLQPTTENSMGSPCNNNTINNTTNNKSPINPPKNLKTMHTSDKHNNVPMPKCTRSRSATCRAKGRATAGPGAKKRRKNNTATVSAGSTNAGSPYITTPGSTTSEPAMVGSRLNKTPKSDMATNFRNQAIAFGEEDIYSNVKSSPSMETVSPSTAVTKHPAKPRKNQKKASTLAFPIESASKNNSNNVVTAKKHSPSSIKVSRRKSTPSIILNADATKDENDMLRTFSNNTTPNMHSAPPTKTINSFPFSGLNLGSFNKPAVSSPLSSVTESCFDSESGKVIVKGGPKRAVNGKASAPSPLNIATPPPGDSQKQRNSKTVGNVVIKPPQGFSTTNLNITLKSSKIIPSLNNLVPQELPTREKPPEPSVNKDPRNNKGNNNALSTPEEKTPSSANQAYDFGVLKNAGSLLFPNQAYTSTNRTPNGNLNFPNETSVSINKGNDDRALVQPASDIGATLETQQPSTAERQNPPPQNMKFENVGMVGGQEPDYDINLLEANENDFNFINWEG